MQIYTFVIKSNGLIKGHTQQYSNPQIYKLNFPNIFCPL